MQPALRCDALYVTTSFSIRVTRTLARWSPSLRGNLLEAFHNSNIIFAESRLFLSLALAAGPYNQNTPQQRWGLAICCWWVPAAWFSWLGQGVPSPCPPWCSAAPPKPESKKLQKSSLLTCWRSVPLFYWPCEDGPGYLHLSSSSAPLADD